MKEQAYFSNYNQKHGSFFYHHNYLSLFFFVTRKKVFVIVLTVEDSYVMVNKLTKDIVLLVGITTLYIRSTC